MQYEYGSKRIFIVKPDTFKWEFTVSECGLGGFKAERVLSNAQAATQAFNELNGYDYICIPTGCRTAYMCKINFFSIEIQSDKVRALLCLELWGEEK